MELTRHIACSAHLGTHVPVANPQETVMDDSKPELPPEQTMLREFGCKEFSVATPSHAKSEIS